MPPLPYPIPATDPRGQQTPAGPSSMQNPGPSEAREVKQTSQLSTFSDDSASLNPSFPHYEDPASLLRVIPLANYAPTARGTS